VQRACHFNICENLNKKSNDERYPIFLYDAHVKKLEELASKLKQPVIE
jgi:hypothetical protein